MTGSHQVTHVWVLKNWTGGGNGRLDSKSTSFLGNRRVGFTAERKVVAQEVPWLGCGDGSRGPLEWAWFCHARRRGGAATVGKKSRREPNDIRANLCRESNIHFRPRHV